MGFLSFSFRFALVTLVATIVLQHASSVMGYRFENRGYDYRGNLDPNYEEYEKTEDFQVGRQGQIVDYDYDGYNRRQSRQGIVELLGLSGLGGPGLMLGVAGALAAVFITRDVWDDFLTTTTTTTAATVTTSAPLSCADGAALYCGIAGNICSGKSCTCGSTGSTCNDAILTYCRTTTATYSVNDASSTCQCGGSGSEDSCQKANEFTTTPLCGAVSGTGGTVGACGKCTKVAGTAGDGDGTTRGSCPNADSVCNADGSCKCAKEANKNGAGDGSTQGTCQDTSQKCQASGDCL